MIESDDTATGGGTFYVSLFSESDIVLRLVSRELILHGEVTFDFCNLFGRCIEVFDRKVFIKIENKA